MITPVTIRNTLFGTGTPKICIPIIGHSEEEILANAAMLKKYKYDAAEWRMDYYDDIFEPEKAAAMLKKLREIIGGHLLLATFRTAKEGGEKNISTDYYKELNILSALSGYIDLIDIELFTGDDIIKNMVSEIHGLNVKIIMSNHDFVRTPAKEEIISRLIHMQELGADILKIAVMPQTSEDVLTLLSATNTMKESYAVKPLITMSMGSLGVVSRLCGSIFGNAMTFGTAGKVSAPGQIDAEALKNILEIVG